MKRAVISFLVFFVLSFSNCKKQNVVDSADIKKGNSQIDQIDEPYIRTPENIPPIPPGMRMYNSIGTDDVFAPDGKMVRVYVGKTLETQWGPIHAPVIYLYDKENRILFKYNILDLVSEDFWGGTIEIKYNNERNSFDMVFSLDAHGNYGTAYIDLNTNQFVRELLIIPDERDEQALQRLQRQGIPDDYIEGTNTDLQRTKK